MKTTIRHSKKQKIGVYTVGAEVGSYVMPDDHGNFWSGQVLEECEHKEPVGDSWPGADFRFPVGFHKVGVNVHISGKTIQYRSGESIVRVRIEWVGDGEPSTFSGGWMIVREPRELEYK